MIYALLLALSLPAAAEVGGRVEVADAPALDVPTPSKAFTTPVPPSERAAPAAEREAPVPPAARAAPAPADGGGAEAAPVASTFPLSAPQIPGGGPLRGLVSLLVLLLALGALIGSRWLREHLAPEGLLPTALRRVEMTARLGVVIAGLVVATALLPASLAAAIPWAIVAGAVALGWSSRELLLDLLAGIWLGLEHQLRPGQRLSTGEVEGVVIATGLRALRLRGDDGAEIAVPNWGLLNQPVRADGARWAAAEGELSFDAAICDGHAPREIRASIERAAHLTPWLAPGSAVEIDRIGPGRWLLRVRVLAPAYRSRFVEGVQRKATALLAAPTGAEPDGEE